MANATFIQSELTYRIGGKDVSQAIERAAANALTRQFKANIRLITQQMQNRTITIEQWYRGMQQESKYLHMAAFALAYGGWDNVPDEAWAQCEQVVLAHWEGIPGQFPGLRAFAEDLQDGRYGTKEIRAEVLTRGGMYAEAGRLTYANQRLANALEQYPMEAKRVLGAVEHCTGENNCVTLAGLGWISAGTMYQVYPLGISPCGPHCYCAIVTRRMVLDSKQQGWNALEQAVRLGLAGIGTAAGIGVALLIMRAVTDSPVLLGWFLDLVFASVENWMQNRVVTS